MRQPGSAPLCNPVLALFPRILANHQVLFIFKRVWANTLKVVCSPTRYLTTKVLKKSQKQDPNFVRDWFCSILTEKVLSIGDVAAHSAGLALDTYTRHRRLGQRGRACRQPKSLGAVSHHGCLAAHSPAIIIFTLSALLPLMSWSNCRQSHGPMRCTRLSIATSWRSRSWTCDLIYWFYFNL
jgi:hypothetical protein